MLKQIQTQNMFFKGLLFLKKITALSIIFISFAYAQHTGSISGRITDKSNNEILIGANVMVAGTTIGASTDIDGFYSIKGISPGEYQIRVSYISYSSVVIEKVIIKENQNTILDVPLSPASTELEEVVVTAEVLRDTEASILKIQQKSEGIVDGVSSELISKNNSSDGTDVLKRMTGVTIADGKFAFVRGVGDRYNNTLLNGANLPSTDPEKKSFSYDIFPASLIENIITAKTFTPDKPADFTGGLVQISTIEFPSRFTLDINTSGSYEVNSTGKSFLSYNGGNKDFLAYDDGTRKMPSLVGDKKLVRGNYTSNELSDIGKSFSNNWNTKSSNAPVNGNLKITIGDKFNFGEDILGYIGSFTYSNSYNSKQREQSAYTFEGARYNYKGNVYSHSVMLSGLLNFSYKFNQSNKISLKNIYNQNADDEVTSYEGPYRYADQYRQNTAFRYVSRTLLSNQLIGEHSFNLLNGLNFDWNLSYSNSKRDEPDARRYVYSRILDEPESPLRFQLDQSLATRYYGNLDDDNYTVSFNFKIKPFENPSLPKFKFGYNYDDKSRDFSARLFGFRNVPGGNFSREDSILQGPVEGIFSPANFNSTFIEVTEITKPSDSYDSKQTIHAAYLMTDAKISNSVRLVAGLRLENSKQIMNSLADTGDDADVSENYSDILPAVNLTYAANEELNFRLAYSTTLARPEFRELASFTYFDFLANELVIGNPNLKRSLIYNYDFRTEYYPSYGELYALGFFYKRFQDPIEQVLIASSSFEPLRSYKNASTAKGYGVELEVRKSLAFLYADMKDFSMVSNISLIKSEIELSNGSTNGSSFQDTKRALQGQAEYILNFGLYYDNIELGLNSSLVYNKVGMQIAKVGFGGLGDVIEKPRDLVDFSISQKFFQSLSLKFVVKDILNQDKIQIQKTPDGDRVSELTKLGTSYSIGLSYQL